MSRGLYQYTLLYEDGNAFVMEPTEKLDIYDFYKLLDCRTVELIPKEYWPDWVNKRATVWGDEEARRFDETDLERRNKHMKVLKGSPVLGELAEWDCLGTLLIEEVYHA